MYEKEGASWVLAFTSVCFLTMPRRGSHPVTPCLCQHDVPAMMNCTPELRASQNKHILS